MRCAVGSAVFLGRRPKEVLFEALGIGVDYPLTEKQHAMARKLNLA